MEINCVDDFVNRLNLGVVLLIKMPEFAQLVGCLCTKNVSELASLVSCFGKNCLSEFA